MKYIAGHVQIFQKHFRAWLLAGVALSCLIFGTSSFSPQQPTASLIAMHGGVSVAIQGGSPLPGVIGMVLHEGDSVRTRAGANVTVELSDRSTLELAENTAVTISVLVEDPQTGASRSNLELWWGSLRSVLQAAQAAAGSSITVQTSNARTDVEATQQASDGSDSEIIYDPHVNTTTAIAHKFDVVMTNLLTEESLLIPQGNVGLVQGETIQEVSMTITFPPGDDSLAELIAIQGDGADTIKAQLDRIALFLQQIPNKTIIIEGHTDNVGDETSNMKLGQSRADNVKSYFVGQHAIVSERLKTVSYGSTRPIADNSAEAGRAQNRRVEVH